MNEAISVISSFTNWGKELEKETPIHPIPRERIKKILEELRKS